MTISWFEILAQIINFFVLLAILQFLFYKPVMKAMEDRKERILSEEKAAKAEMDKAKSLIHNYRDKINNIEEEKEKMLLTYKEEAKEVKEEMLKKYKDEADQKRENYLKEIQEEKDSFIETLRQDLGSSAVAIAKKVLQSISTADLENEVYKLFIKDIDNLKENLQKDEMLEDVRQIVVSSSKPLNNEQEREIRRSLRRNLYKVNNISFKVDDSLVLGYEINLETFTIHNSVKNYLNEVESNIKKMLAQESL